VPVPRAGVRQVVAGLVDQALMAGANAAMTLLPLGLFGKDRAGALVLSIGLGYLVLAVNREFVGNVLLAQASRLTGADRDRLVRHGLAAAATFGAAASLVLLAVWAFWREPAHDVDLRDLIWLVPFLPVVLCYDASRYAWFARRAQVTALRFDLIWVGAQAACLVLFGLLGELGPGALLASWGLGACAALAAYLLRTGARPWRGHPRRWIAETRQLSGWFTATALVGQFQVQAVGFLVAGRLGRGDVAILRSAQTAFLQPVQNLVTASMGLLVPRASRLAEAGDRAGLHRLTLRLAAGFAGLGVLLVAVLVPVAHALRPHLGPYAPIAALALPVCVQGGVYLLQIPFAAAMRGMHRARLLFVQYLLFTAASLTGLLIGAARHDLRTTVWGLVCGSAVGVAVMIGMYGWAARELAPPRPVPEVVSAP
jgi:O-antigen/teichoic acid export membrane protein